MYPLKLNQLTDRTFQLNVFIPIYETLFHAPKHIHSKILKHGSLHWTLGKSAGILECLEYRLLKSVTLVLHITFSTWGLSFSSVIITTVHFSLLGTASGSTDATAIKSFNTNLRTQHFVLVAVGIVVARLRHIRRNELCKHATLDFSQHTQLNSAYEHFMILSFYRSIFMHLLRSYTHTHMNMCVYEWFVCAAAASWARFLVNGIFCTCAGTPSRDRDVCMWVYVFGFVLRWCDSLFLDMHECTLFWEFR